MMRSHILGTGFSVPDRVVTNDDLAEVMDTSDEWIRTRTGIQERRWVKEGERGVGLGLDAARRAMTAAGIQVEDLDAIVYATSTPDNFAPGNGVLLQHALGAGSIPAIDIRTQCSGFVYSLSVADAWIRTGDFEHILVVGQEIQSTGMDVTSRGRDTAVIFADGAGAVVVGPSDSDDRGFLAFDLHGDGGGAQELWVDRPGSQYHPRITAADVEAGRHYLAMNGKEVFRNAIARMPESTTAALAKAGLSPRDISLLIPHQANLRISEMVQRALELGEDRVYNNIMRYGNTTAASIPIALDECIRSGRISPGDVVVLTAFGSGFLWGSVVIRW